MSVICPTVLAASPLEYAEQLRKVATLSSRIHVDLGDGVFAEKTIAPVQAWWDPSQQVDLHVMFARPQEQLETLISLMPRMIIFQAEAEGDIRACLEHVKKLGIKAGVTLLQGTKPSAVGHLLEVADHALIFSGDLGHFGGKVDLGLLSKIKEIKAINGTIEIGWDGGVNESNAADLVHGGVDVLNVGGTLQQATDAQAAYATLVGKITDKD